MLFLSLKNSKNGKMKTICFALATLLTVNCGSTQVSESAKKESPVLPASEESFTNAERMGEMVNYLASNDLKGRDTGSEGIAMAAKYIENYFKSYGLSPYFETYRDTLN